MILQVWDPGKATGYAKFEYDEQGIKLLRTSVFDDDPASLVKWYQRQLNTSLVVNPDYPNVGVFLIEKWMLFAGKAESQTNLEQIAAVVRGRVEIIATLLGATLAYQKAADMKEISNQLLLSKLSLTELPTGEHRKDAMKHGLFYWLRWRDKQRNKK